MRPVKRPKAGFIILEILATMAILLVLVLSTGSYRAMVAGHFKEAISRYRAINLAISQMEDLKQIAKVSFGDPKLAEGSHPHADSRLAIPQGYTISYTILDKYDWPEDGTDSSIPPPAGDDTIDYKETNVSCTYSTDKKTELFSYIVYIS